MALDVSDVSAMFAYAYDKHHRVKDGELRRVRREGLVESMIDWLLRYHDAHAPIFLAAGLRTPGRFKGVDGQRRTELQDGRTDIELEFANARTIVELKVGARLEPSQLQAYVQELTKHRSRHAKTYGTHVVIVTRDADLSVLTRQLEGLRKDGTINKSTGVRVAVTTYGRIADKDPTGRWAVIKMLTDDLAAPRTPIAGTPSVFKQKALADWAEDALSEISELSDPDFRRELKEAAAHDYRMERVPSGRITERRPAFATDSRCTEAWFHAHGSTSDRASAASITIDPWALGEPNEALIWVAFKRKYQNLYVPFPSSDPGDNLRPKASVALQAVWHVLWAVTERLRESGWSTPKGQPQVTEAGIVPIRLVNKSGNLTATLFFDPGWLTWRRHGPLGIAVAQPSAGTDPYEEAWRLPRESGQTSLDQWMRWAVDQLVEHAMLSEA